MCAEKTRLKWAYLLASEQDWFALLVEGERQTGGVHQELWEGVC